jgi:hypothetical protein
MARAIHILLCAAPAIVLVLAMTSCEPLATVEPEAVRVDVPVNAAASMPFNIEDLADVAASMPVDAAIASPSIEASPRTDIEASGQAHVSASMPISVDAPTSQAASAEGVRAGDRSVVIAGVTMAGSTVAVVVMGLVAVSIAAIAAAVLLRRQASGYRGAVDVLVDDHLDNMIPRHHQEEIKAASLQAGTERWLKPRVKLARRRRGMSESSAEQPANWTPGNATGGFRRQ